MDLTILLTGALVTSAWWYGMFIAYWRKRWMLTAGMWGAGAAAVIFTLVSGGVDIPKWMVDVAAISRVWVALFLVGSFVAHQPHMHVPRPERWTP